MYFNPRPHEEGDFMYLVPNLDFQISIHALMKRATAFTYSLYCSQVISIHALMKRATANLYNDYLYFGTKYHISDIFPQ